MCWSLLYSFYSSFCQNWRYVVTGCLWRWNIDRKLNKSTQTLLLLCSLFTPRYPFNLLVFRGRWKRLRDCKNFRIKNMDFVLRYLLTRKSRTIDVWEKTYVASCHRSFMTALFEGFCETYFEEAYTKITAR